MSYQQMNLQSRVLWPYESNDLPSDNRIWFILFILLCIDVTIRSMLYNHIIDHNVGVFVDIGINNHNVSGDHCNHPLLLLRQDDLYAWTTLDTSSDQPEPRWILESIPNRLWIWWLNYQNRRLISTQRMVNQSGFTIYS